MASWAIVDLLGIATGIFVFTAIYRDTTTVGTYNYSQLVSYYILIPLIAGITNVFVTVMLPNQIKTGNISNRLLKPYSIPVGAFLTQVSLKVMNYMTRLPLFALLIGVAISFFDFELNPKNISTAIIVAVFAFFLHFLIDLCISLSAFWVNEVWALSHLKWVSLLIFGGQMFPIDLLPQNLRKIFEFLPLKFVYYVPTALLQGRIDTSTLQNYLLQMGGWSVVFLMLAKIMWVYGIKKYEAFGN